MPYIGSRVVTSARYVATGSSTRRVGGSSPEEMRQAMSNSDHRVRPKIGVPVVIRGRKNVPMPTIATARTASRPLALSSSLRDGGRVVSELPSWNPLGVVGIYPNIDLIMPNVLSLTDPLSQRTLDQDDHGAHCLTLQTRRIGRGPILRCAPFEAKCLLERARHGFDDRNSGKTT
jgi:hypothetical protein